LPEGHRCGVSAGTGRPFAAVLGAAGTLTCVLLRIWQEYGLKLFRYCGVSVFNLVFGQTLLFVFFVVLDWQATLANLAAVAISAGPAYLLSRRWVWSQTGAHSVRNEIAPFWGLALLGLLLSTIAVTIAEDRWDSGVAVALASIASFGVVWVFKFVILEKIMWKDAVIEVVEVADLPAR
jgi:putative flippase GtrA